MRATGERRHGSWTERTDPHGFAPVEDAPSVPRQRDRPAHDPWDPAHQAADRSVAVDRDGYPARRARRADAPPRRATGDTAARTRVADPGPSPDPGLLCGADPADAYRYSEELPPSRPRDVPRRRRPDAPDRAARTATRRPDRADAPGRPDRDGRTRRPDPRDAAADPRSGTFLAPGPRLRTIAIPAAVGSLVAVGIGVWARAHDPTGVAVNLAGFSSGSAVKTWLATLALVLALGQGWTGMALHGRVGSGPTPLTATVHRWSGRLAVLVTLPVAVQCLFALGWSGATTRTLLHSLLGCVFYGAFVTKMLLLNRRGVPGWVLAVCGGLLLAVLAGIWLTSAAWFFGTHGLTF